MVKVIFSLACVGVARTSLRDAARTAAPFSTRGCANGYAQDRLSDHRRHRFLNILHPDSKLHANYFQSPEKDFQLDRPLVLLDT
ncbi:MAG: hypothetical protein RM022_014505 [Nostoc sp. EfeVER01]|uniref:hypothetical protein n=1 Tax=Nostoc sp. EfeVER01 TaxID=3075406 RepID=UPI002AD201D2|nr:hypothetical protein [Nostoc sp. EfeVER01]MDZ7946531.1 hypothetical protein [Nostoc sp. EfeVER01]